MIFKTYLGSNFFIFYIGGLLTLLYLNLYLISLIALLIFILIFFLFKKRKVDLNLLQGDVIFSPTFGKIVGLNNHLLDENEKENISNESEIKNDKNFFSIDILVLPFKDIGLYFPTKCEFSLYRKKKGQKLLLPMAQMVKESSKFQEIIFIKQGKDFLMLRLYPSIFTKKAYIYPLPGDYGNTGAVFGIFPFGGILRFYLPKSYELTAEMGKNVIPSQSILAKKKN